MYIYIYNDGVQIDVSISCAKRSFTLLAVPAYPNDLGACEIGVTEIAEFARACKDIGIQYIGLCCGNSSNKLRRLAETYGRHPPASKYSPDLSQSFYYNKLKKQYEN